MGKRRIKNNRQPIPKRNNNQLQGTRRNSGALCCRRCLADAKTSFVYWNPKDKSWGVRCMKCGHTHPINTYGKQFVVFKTISGGFYAPPDDDAPVFSGQNVTDIYFAGSNKELIRLLSELPEGNTANTTWYWSFSATTGTLITAGPADARDAEYFTICGIPSAQENERPYRVYHSSYKTLRMEPVMPRKSKKPHSTDIIEPFERGSLTGFAQFEDTFGELDDSLPLQDSGWSTNAIDLMAMI